MAQGRPGQGAERLMVHASAVSLPPLHIPVQPQVLAPINPTGPRVLLGALQKQAPVYSRLLPPHSNVAHFQSQEVAWPRRSNLSITQGQPLW